MPTFLPRLTGVILIALAVAACSPSESNSSASPPPVNASEVPPATPRATCGPGSRPETGIQGRVSREDH
ncbi:MAG: hypothetical protein ABIR53_07965, partial [Paraperlucidibaca sp.]